MVGDLSVNLVGGPGSHYILCTEEGYGAKRRIASGGCSRCGLLFCWHSHGSVLHGRRDKLILKNKRRTPSA